MDQISYDKFNENEKDIISIRSEISEILERIEIFKIKTFYVIDGDQVLIGVITEGDIRRSLIKGAKITDDIAVFINHNPKCHMYEELVKLGTTKINNSSKRLPVISNSRKLMGFFPKNNPTNDFFSASTALGIAPTRISFAGGGSDLNYWFDVHEGCVVNAAIQKYARVKITRNFSNIINIKSLNTGEHVNIHVEDLSGYNHKTLSIIVKCLTHCGVIDGLDIDIICDFAPGTGLGGSSSLVTATLLALSKIYKFNLSVRETVDLSYFIERNVVGIPGGWQDQIISAFGGLCITRFYEGKYDTFKIAMSEQNLAIMNSQLFLSPIGNDRSSGDVHELQKKESIAIEYEEKMNRIVALANECAELLGQGKVEDLGKILDEGWQFKKSLGSFISNDEVDKRYEFLLKNGAEGGRLLGAGMSGYILVLVSPEKQLAFLTACNENEIPIERVYLDIEGARVL